MSKGPLTWFSAQFAGLVRSEGAWQWMNHWSVGSPAAEVLLRKSSYVTPTVPSLATWTDGVKAWTSPGDWSIRDSGDQVSPPSVDSVKTMVLWKFDLTFSL